MIKTLVLTFDKQIGLAQLLIKKYINLGAASFLEFIVPINSKKNEFKVDGANVNFVQSEPDILSTLKTLLNLTADEEWVYWAIDDRYPIKIDVLKFNKIKKSILENNIDANAIKLLYWGEPLQDCLNDFFVQEPRSMIGFWHHQFIKSKILKSVFLEKNINQLNQITPINNYYKNENYLHFLKNILISKNNIICLGEPLAKGKLTKNGLEELVINNCTIPEYGLLDYDLFFIDYVKQIKIKPKCPAQCLPNL